MRIGILGSGFMGETHARAYAKLPDVQIAAVSSRHMEKAEKLAKEVGARAFVDDTAILNDPTIEAVSITLPTHLHREYAIAALQAGKHVLLEKPFGLTAADCDAVIAAHKQSGKKLMLAHVVRFWPEYVALVEFVQSGKLGRPLTAVATRLSVLPGWADWFTDPVLSGGAILDLSIHDYDALNWLFGQPKTVYARGHEARPGLWNQVISIVDYGSVHGSVEGSEMMPKDYPFTASLKVICEGGVVDFTFRAGGVSVEMSGGTTLTVYQPGKAYKLAAKEGDAYGDQIAYFVECARTNSPIERGTPEQGRLAVQTCAAARKSLGTGVPVSVE